MAFGALDLYGTIATVLRGRGVIGFGFITLFVGVGLLCRRRGAYPWAMVLLGLASVGLPVLALSLLFGARFTDLYVCGFGVQDTPPVVLVVGALAGAGAAVWLLITLRRPDVVRLFYADAA